MSQAICKKPSSARIRKSLITNQLINLIEKMVASNEMLENEVYFIQ